MGWRPCCWRRYTETVRRAANNRAGKKNNLVCEKKHRKQPKHKQRKRVYITNTIKQQPKQWGEQQTIEALKKNNLVREKKHRKFTKQTKTQTKRNSHFQIQSSSNRNSEHSSKKIEGLDIPILSEKERKKKCSKLTKTKIRLELIICQDQLAIKLLAISNVRT